MLSDARRLFPAQDFMFQQDNDPKHKALTTTAFLEANQVRILEWPPQRPDLNPTEKLWAIMEQNMLERTPSNDDEEELFETVTAA